MTMENETAMPTLTEDNVSDLLWLVLNHGDKLTEDCDYINQDYVDQLANTLEAILNKMG